MTDGMHQIHIPPHIVERAIARRGSRYLFDNIDPARTALLVIDMQNCFLVPGFSVIEVPASRAIVPNINRLAAALRAAGGLVCWTLHTFRKDWETWHEYLAKGEFRERMISETAEGSYGYQIHKSMDVQAADVQVMKTRYSALIPGSSELDKILRDKGIDTVIITGTLTNVCCESTARDAMMLGYRTVFVADGNATRSDEEHNAVLASMVQVFADVRFTDEIVALITADPNRTTLGPH